MDDNGEWAEMLRVFMEGLPVFVARGVGAWLFASGKGLESFVEVGFEFLWRWSVVVVDGKIYGVGSLFVEVGDVL